MLYIVLFTSIHAVTGLLNAPRNMLLLLLLELLEKKDLTCLASVFPALPESQARGNHHDDTCRKKQRHHTLHRSMIPHD